MEPADRFEDFVGLIAGLSKEIQRIKAVEGAKLGLKGADIMCLYYLCRHPEGLTGAELARLSGVTRAAVSRTLAHAEERGLVEVCGIADAANRYRAPVRLTPSGAEAMASVDAVIERVLNETAAALGEEQRAQMYESLAVILDRLRSISR